MSIVFGMALCALIGVIALVFGLGILKIRLTDLESETKLLYELSQSQYKLSQSQEEYIDSLTKYFEKKSDALKERTNNELS